MLITILFSLLFQLMIYHIINIGLLFVYPYILICYFQLDFFWSEFILLFDVAIMMKIISFIHVNSHMRKIIYTIQIAKEANQEMPTFYRQFIGDQLINDDDLQILIEKSDNPNQILSVKHFVYFILAPTMCYQLKYPRNEKIRIMFIIKSLFELFLAAIVFL